MKKKIVNIKDKKDIEKRIRKLGFENEETVKALTNIVCYIFGIIEELPEEEKKRWQELNIMEGDKVLIDDSEMYQDEEWIGITAVEIVLFGLTWEGKVERVVDEDERHNESI